MDYARPIIPSHGKYTPRGGWNDKDNGDLFMFQLPDHKLELWTCLMSTNLNKKKGKEFTMIGNKQFISGLGCDMVEILFT